MHREERDMGSSMGAGKANLWVFLCALVGVLLLAAPASATQTHVFEETFGPVAQPTVDRPASIAVDQSSGDVLVIEAGANRIARYHADGTPSDFSALAATNFIDGLPGEADVTPQGA